MFDKFSKVSQDNKLSAEFFFKFVTILLADEKS